MPIAMHWATGNEDSHLLYMWQSVYAYAILRLTDAKIPSLAMFVTQSQVFWYIVYY